MSARFVLLPVLALLGACEGESARVTVNADAQSTLGTVKVNGASGFKADLTVPGLGKLAGNMDIDGVKPFPSSTFSGIDIDAADERDEKVALTFVAPARRAEVADWYARQFRDNGFAARTTPTGYAGTTKDGDWFTLDLTEEGGRTTGAFKLGKTQS